jgi:uncharacterized membrane protein YjgN (DUF898 family)
MQITTEETKLPREYRFQFTGSAREFFAIWIVNLLLTVLTLGIYSAWAKVRSNRYFYNNTWVDNSAFDYTAEPKKILLGRVIAVTLLLVYQLSINFFSTVSLYVFGLFVLALPLIFMSSIAFRMRYSQWRGISFSFAQDLGGAYLLFSPVLLYLILVTGGPLFFGLSPDEAAGNVEDEASTAFQFFLIFSFALALLAMAVFPAWQCWYYNFIGNRSGFGRERFSLTLKVGKFYGMYASAFGIVLLGVVMAGLLAVFGSRLLGPEPNDSSVASQILLIYLFFTLLYAAGYALVQTRLTNAIYSGLSLQGIQVNCALEYRAMLFFYVTNTLAILFSLGLAIPWARVRVARYRASRTSLSASDLGQLASQPEDEVSASADAVSDLFDLDIGL